MSIVDTCLSCEDIAW